MLAALYGPAQVKPEDRKKLKEWKNAQRALAQSAFPLEEAELDSLFDFLDEELGKAGCDHSYKLSKAWLSEKRHDESRVVSWFQEHGGYCDCEVLANVEQHFDENR